MLQALQLLRSAGPLVQPGPVASSAVADQLHVGLRLGQLALDVLVCRAGQGELSAHDARLVLELGDLLALGQTRARVGELVEPGVQCLHLEQPVLPDGFG